MRPMATIPSRIPSSLNEFEQASFTSTLTQRERTAHHEISDEKRVTVSTTQ